MTYFNLKTLATAAALAVAVGGVAHAQEGAAFYNNKTVNFIVATDVGGGYDTYGRLVAEFMQKHLPGSTFVVRNMPGAGHLIGANYIYAAEADGLTVGTFNTGLIYGQLTGDSGVRFDLGNMSWVGKVAADPRVIIAASNSGIDSWDDLANSASTVRFAAAGVGSAAAVESTMLINVLGLPAQVITGYNGNEGELAMMRGEVQAQLASRSSIERFVQEGNARFIAQIGGSQDDVPQLSDLVESTEALQAIALVQGQVEIVRFVAGPPNIPADRLDALRVAFEAAVTDPEFLARADALGLPVDPLVGDDVAEAISRALDQTPEVIDFLRGALGN